MKQLLQDARTGEIEIAEVPVPKLLPGCVLVRIASSLVSAGTERASSEFASKNLLQKAAARPDLVRDVITKVRRDGILSAWQVARSRLDEPLSLGYSSAGTVVEVAPEVKDLRPGDGVACAGAGYAVHAEFVCVPRLLVAKIPERAAISFDEAAFTTVGAVALHGIRTAGASLGDLVAVIGLGLLGQLTLQLLKAAGCRVLGFDVAPDRADLAKQLGADVTSASREAFRDLCLQISRDRGADSVLVCAETASSDAVNLAAEIARDRAIITAVGTVGMDIDRKLYYGKELDFRISRSYGPGRYDAAYEQKGRDYPIGYVRWTETRNMEAFLDLLAGERLRLQPLITHRFPIEFAGSAYDLIMGRRREPHLGIVLTYSVDARSSGTVELSRRLQRQRSQAVVNVVGAGNFATSTLLPALKASKQVQLRGVFAASGVHAQRAARKFGFAYCATNEQQILNDPECDAVVIATRHHLHAQQVISALEAGKHVFAEKPLCLSEDELSNIIAAYLSKGAGRMLTVGFNRRFAPMILRLKKFFSENTEPLAMQYRINAGQLPPDHWVNDPEQGGGRILGEVCHFIDLLIFLTGSTPVKLYARKLGSSVGNDSVSILVDFADGSQGTIQYLENGDRGYSKERLEVFSGGAIAVLDDFRRLELVRHGIKTITRNYWRQDKGHAAALQAFINAIVNGTAEPVAFEDIVATTLTTFRIQDSLARGEPVEVDAAAFLRSAANSASAVPA